MAEMRLDELSAPEDPDMRPLREIVAEGLEIARSFGASQGIDVLDMTMGVIEPPKELAAQIVSNWQVEWKRRAKVLEVKARPRQLSYEKKPARKRRRI